jgi:hypothetical protein
MLESPVFTCISPFRVLRLTSRFETAVIGTRETPLFIQMFVRVTHAPPSVICLCNPPKQIKQYQSNRLPPPFPPNVPSAIPPPSTILTCRNNDYQPPRVDRRAKPKSDEIKWQDLLEKFRSVQFRHEKARSKAQILPRSPHIETNPSTPAIGPPAVSKRNSIAPAQHKRGRSIQNFTQGIMGVGRSSGETKKVSGSKR